MLEIEALQNDIFGPVSFALKSGQSLVIGGESGSGKTRFLRALADLDQAEGQVVLNGRTRGSMAAFEWRRRVRFVPAASSWWFDDVAAHFHSPEKLKAQMALLELPQKLLAAKTSDLSTGERQRLAFLRAIEDQPEVLLLDEPTSALDEPGIKRLEGLIDCELDRGAIVLLVSHSSEQKDKYGPISLNFDAGRAELSGFRLEDA